MATDSQIHANQANAQFSTGPKTADGKARASRNNLRHGLTLGVLTVTEAEQPAFCEFEANLRAEIKPEGLFELEAFQQFLDAAWRLHKIEAIIDALFTEYNEDPFVHPEAGARLNQLTRYRAAAEMIAYRAVKTLRELQTIRLARMWHLTPQEREVFPPMAHPPAVVLLGGVLRSTNAREVYYVSRKIPPFEGRLKKPICEVEPNRDQPNHDQPRAA